MRRSLIMLTKSDSRGAKILTRVFITKLQLSATPSFNQIFNKRKKDELSSNNVKRSLLMDYLLIVHLQILYYPWYNPWFSLKAKRYMNHGLSSCKGAISLNVFLKDLWWYDFGEGTWSEIIWCVYDIASTWSKRSQISMTSYIINPWVYFKGQLTMKSTMDSFWGFWPLLGNNFYLDLKTWKL